MYTPTLPPRRLDAGMRAFSSASQVSSSASRLLGIHVVGFHLRRREELGVKTLRSLRYPPRVRALAIARPKPRLVHELRPATLGQIGDGVAASSSACHLVGGCSSPGNRVDSPTIAMSSTRRAAGSSPRRRRPELRLAFDDHRRERLDGRVSERHRRGQRHAGEVLDIAAHHRRRRATTGPTPPSGRTRRRRPVPARWRWPPSCAATLHLGHRHVVAGWSTPVRVPA